MKAVMVSIVTEHTEWPETEPNGKEKPVVVGFVRSIPFEDEFAEAVADLQKNGFRVEMKKLESLNQALDCQVVYFPENAHAAHRAWLIPLREKPILTIGESNSFCRDGGILRLSIENRKINMLLNVDAMSDAGIRISSAVARQAAIFREAGGGASP